MRVVATGTTAPVGDAALDEEAWPEDEPLVPTSWCPDGPVVLVAGCAGGVGATVLSLALAEQAGRGRVVECCSVTRSGLSAAAAAEMGRRDSGWAQGLRGSVSIDRPSQVIAGPAGVPVPEPTLTSHDLTVLDVGWDLGQVLQTPCWLQDQLYDEVPVVLVTTATVPGMHHVEQTLALLPDPARAVVAVRGPRLRRWPRPVRSSLGTQATALAEQHRLVEVAESGDLLLLGLDRTVLPRPLLQSAGAVLDAITELRLSKGPQS